MAERVSIQVSFPEQGNLIVPSEMGEFLTKFSQVYEAAVYATRFKSPEAVLVERENFRVRVHEVLAGKAAAWLAPEDRPVEEDEQLTCTKLSFGSPLDIVLCGTGAALVLSVIVCGGEVKLFPPTFKINTSLGKGLKDLIALFSQAKAKAKAKAPPPPAKAPAKKARKVQRS